ncbi:BACON domain-containing protein [Allomuricauda sp. ARW1Y1]|jgi:hypothetical protein|uniref:BACON domain-containing protein n=1 Tax=Allomuricauda sp. ARW1Y1 TaxID=2663843 RepID=UPI0015CBF0DB|nr:BACON domain-containing protein [Muricauda sp. ARW1Y1]NYJ27501.1 hypothetical protein [Muricauda sp. ARW1Y1]
MPLNPTSPLAIEHKKFRTLASEFVDLTVTSAITAAPQVTNPVSWLSISLWGFNNYSNPSVYTYNFKLTSLANNLSPGNHETEIVFKYFRDQAGFPTVVERYVVKLTVEDTIKLTISRASINITYTIGGPVPPTEFFTLGTENPWTTVISDSRVSLNRNSGSGGTNDVNMELDVDVSGLQVGNYQYTVLFDDGYDRLTLDVFLEVINENVANDFLIVSPESFQLSVQEGSTSSVQRSFEVDSSENFTLSSSQSWLKLSSNSETAGLRTITASTQNTDGLSAGTHIAEITVTSSYTVKKISIVLLVNATGTDGVVDGTLYFSDDRDLITLASASSNKELVLRYQINEGQYNFEKVLPFINGQGKALLGDVANNLVEHRDFLQTSITKAFVPVDPLRMVITAFDKTLDSTQLNNRGTYENILLLTGSTPQKTDWLTYVPELLRTSNKGLVSFSFRADSAPVNIQISGAVTATKAISSISGPIYTCLVNLSEFELVEGDEIDIRCGVHTVKVKIIARAPEETHLCWLNEWNCPEFATMYGHLDISKGTEKVTGNYAVNGKEVTKVLEVRKPKDFGLRTGFLYGTEYYEYYASILDSKKIWIHTEGQWEEVICENTSMEIYRTREFFKSYMLRFKKAAI